MKFILPYLFILILSQIAVAQNKKICILFPMFKSQVSNPINVGMRTSRILSLQVWRTLRKPPQLNNSDSSGCTLPDYKETPQSYEEAEALSRRHENIKLVLWGKAFEYGNGIVVESNLSIINDERDKTLQSELWKAIITRAGRRQSVSVGIPEWRYQFAPIVLKSDILPEINSELQIKVYEQPNQDKFIGYLGSEGFTAVSHQGDFTKIAGRGWIYLPNISKDRSEVVHFCAGIIRILRKDWDGALEMFSKVINESNAPTSVKTDAYLYMAIAADKKDDRLTSLSFIEEAYRLNPYLQTTTKYYCMNHLAYLSRLNSQQLRSEDAKKSISAVRDILSKNKILFAENDKWIKSVEQFLAYL